jgi:acetone carboxylase gamma subunit
MNERIKELAKQAKKHALDAMIKIADREQALKVYSESYDTKFAELIVRECADIATMNQYQSYTPGHYVLKHFGVEE